MQDLLCLGEVILDLISDVPVDRIEDCRAYLPRAGGSPANLARFGARAGLSTAFLGRVGSDGAGRLIRRALEQDGVDTSRLQVSRTDPTSVCLIARSSETPDFMILCGADQGLRP